MNYIQRINDVHEILNANNEIIDEDNFTYINNIQEIINNHKINSNTTLDRLLKNVEGVVFNELEELKNTEGVDLSSFGYISKLDSYINELYTFCTTQITDKIIEEFSIIKLYGRYDIKINFEEKIKIFVGENGSGKTTVLNILYYLISKNYKKLLEFDFESISIKFYGKENISISKEDINEYNNTWSNIFNRPDKRKIKDNYTLFYNYLITQYSSYNNLRINYKFKNINNIYTDYKDKFSNYFDDNDISLKKLSFNNISISLFESYIDEENLKIIYLPTYRRVEVDFEKLEELKGSYKKDELEFINFGMNDVDNNIEKILEEIKEKTRKGYLDLSKKLLEKMIANSSSENDLTKICESKDKIDVMLERMEGLDGHKKSEILEILKDIKKLNSRQDLVYLLLELLNIYDDVAFLENKLINFMNKCNEYLHKKDFCYIPSNIDFGLYREHDPFKKNKLILNNLSSGEQQLISIFSKIYLENEENLFIIFDEPELSLSIKWQERLLPDIYDSVKCKFLIAATHSPFIFNNKLEKFADSLEVYTDETSLF